MPDFFVNIERIAWEVVTLRVEADSSDAAEAKIEKILDDGYPRYDLGVFLAATGVREVSAEIHRDDDELWEIVDCEPVRVP